MSQNSINYIKPKCSSKREQNWWCVEYKVILKCLDSTCVLDYNVYVLWVGLSLKVTKATDFCILCASLFQVSEIMGPTEESCCGMNKRLYHEYMLWRCFRRHQLLTILTNSKSKKNHLHQKDPKSNRSIEK